ncbi:MAG: hypothetical protein JW883_07970, partial [Deltaproteobacteria bacterium]|nr:hypothetical protein [Deltaproteobacteria bacterium]
TVMPDLIRHPVLFLDSPVKPGNDDFWLFSARIILLSRSYRHTTLAKRARPSLTLPLHSHD